MNDATGNAGSINAYVLGHSDREIERLKVQARLIDPITKRIFREAGIVPGMRVLDVGSGAGDVAFLVADMVGETGDVVGVDRVPAASDAARATFVEAGLAAPTMRLEALIGGGATSADVVRIMSDLIATLLPEMERLGVVTASEVGSETLFERMMRESIAGTSRLVGHLQIGAWART